MAGFFRRETDFILAKTISENDPLPAAYSACQLGEREDLRCDDDPCYNGKAGIPELVSSANDDFRDPAQRSRWDIAVPAYAILLAATVDPNRFEPPLARAENLGAPDVFYRPGLGFADAYFVKGPKAGRVVPAILALDQAISALALRAMLAPDGRALSARMLAGSPVVAARLREAYRFFGR